MLPGQWFTEDNHVCWFGWCDWGQGAMQQPPRIAFVHGFHRFSQLPNPRHSSLFFPVLHNSANFGKTAEVWHNSWRFAWIRILRCLRWWPVPITSMRSSFNKCFPFLWSPAHMLCPTGLAMREPKGNKLLLLYMPSAPDMWWQIKAPWIFGTAMCLKSITTWQNALLTQYALRCFSFLCVWDILRMVFDESGRLSGFSEPLLHMPPGKRLWGLQHTWKNAGVLKTPKLQIYITKSRNLRFNKTAAFFPQANGRVTSS